MNRNIAILLGFMILFAACNNNYGKKVNINDNIDVYIKGDKVTESDARKLGDFVATTYKEHTNKKSFQITKDSGQYVIRMVIDEEKVKKDSSINVSFMALQYLFELQVFPGNKVKLILTNDQFKDVKIFPSNSSESAGSPAK
jgi:hypothetical protein